MNEGPANAYRSAAQVLEDGDSAPMLEFVADEVVWWQLGGRDKVTGKQALAEHLARPRPVPMTVNIHDLLANEEHLVVLVHAVAHHETGDEDVSYAEVWHLNDSGLGVKRQAFPASIDAATRLIESREP